MSGPVLLALSLAVFWSVVAVAGGVGVSWRGWQLPREAGWLAGLLVAWNLLRAWRLWQAAARPRPPVSGNPDD